MSARGYRSLLTASLVLLAAGASQALAWPEPRVMFDIRKNFSIGSGVNWGTVQGTYFAHTWWYECDGSVQSTLTNPPAQPVTFYDYGTDRVIGGDVRNLCGPHTYSSPFPSCPYGAHGPVNIGVYSVPMGGTPYSYLNGHSYQIFGAWLAGASSGAEVWYNFAPWGSGLPVVGEMRISGRYTPYWGNRPSGAETVAYSYAAGEVKCFGRVPPAAPIAGFFVDVGIAFNRNPGASPPPPGQPAPRQHNKVRIRDPISYLVVDDVTGVITTGQLFSCSADLREDGDITWDGGTLSIIGLDADFHVEKAGEPGLPDSRYDVVVRNGMVTEFQATGQFAGEGQLAVGMVTPLSTNLNDLLSFNVDVSAAAPNGGDLTIAMSNGGPESLLEDETPPPPPPCDADFDQDGFATVGDIFKYLSGWFALDARTDVDGNPGHTVADIFHFMTRWFRGCP